MKKLKKIALVCTMLMGVSAFAQLSIGGGVGFNDGVDAPGLIVKAEFDIMDNIAISPSFSYFSGSKISSYKNNLMAIDVNGHYKIEMVDDLFIYPLAGLNYSKYNNGFTLSNDIEFSQKEANALGINVGGGGRWFFKDNLSVFAELKYTVSDFSQVVIGGGILLQL